MSTIRPNKPREVIRMQIAIDTPYVTSALAVLT